MHYVSGEPATQMTGGWRKGWRSLAIPHVITHTDEGAHRGLQVRPAAGFLWFTPVIKTMNGSFTCTRLLHFAVETYRNASPACRHLVWLWLDLKTESLGAYEKINTRRHTRVWAARVQDGAQIVQTQLQKFFGGSDLVSAIPFFYSTDVPARGLKHHLHPLCWTQSSSPQLTSSQMTSPRRNLVNISPSVRTAAHISEVSGHRRTLQAEAAARTAVN